MGLASNKITFDGSNIYFIPSGSGLQGAVAGGTTSSYVITMSGHSSTGSNLVNSGSFSQSLNYSTGVTSSTFFGTGSFFSYRSPDNSRYKIFYVSNSNASIEPISGTMPNGVGINTTTGSAIKVTLTGLESGSDIAIKTIRKWSQVPGLKSKIFISASAGVGGTGYLFIRDKASGSAYSDALDTNNIFTSGSAASTASSWGSQSINTGTGTYPGIQFDGYAVNQSASYTVRMESDKSLAITGSGTQQLYFSSSGKIGLNTRDPQRSFDILDNSDDPAEFAVKSGVGSKGYFSVGNVATNLKFLTTSASFIREESGSLANLSSTIIADENGIQSGDLHLQVGKGGNLRTIQRIGHNILETSNTFGTMMSSSLHVSQPGGNVTFDVPFTSSQEIRHTGGKIITSGHIVAVHVTASGDLEVGGEISASTIQTSGVIEGSNIGLNYIPILPTDFALDGDGRGLSMVQNSGGSIKPSNASYDYYATYMIPSGYEATTCSISGSTTNNISLFSSSLFVGTSTPCGLGTLNTDVALAPTVKGDNNKYVIVKWDPATSAQELYGGKITLIKS